VDKIFLNKFIVNLLVFSVILGAIAFTLSFFLTENYFSPALPFLFPFFFAVTILVFGFLLKSAATKFNRFVNRFMMATFLKLMVYMAVLVVYVFTHKYDAIPFILSFFILYLAYTFFEVIALLKFTRTETKK
jgi:phosphoglycerol transferase MdoB-like AlkP superfamily enzyme